MVKWILQNKGKAFWMLLCILAIASVKGRPDLKFFLFGWAVCIPFVLCYCEKRGIPKKWLWSLSNLFFPWIALFVFLLYTGLRELRTSNKE